MNRLYVGMDIGKGDIKVHVLNTAGEKAIPKFSVENTPQGGDQIAEAVISCCIKQHIEQVFFGLEATSVYGWHIQFHLADHAGLAPFAPTIISFNAKVIKAFRGSLGDLPKNDCTDAYVIAERLRFGRLPDSSPVDFRYLALQRLTRHRFHLVESIVREKNYYLSNLFLKCSGLCQEKVFASNFGATAQELFQEFLTLDEIAELPLDALVDFILTHGREHFEAPETTAVKLREAIRKSYRLPADVNHSLNFVIRSCLENIKSLERQKKQTEKAILAEVQGFQHQYLCLSSVKGIGPVIAAGLISEIGGITRFDSDNAIAKYAGLYWTEHQSSGFTAEDTSLRRAGNQYLRYYFVQAADQMRKYIPEYETYYTRKFKEANRHHHKRALVLTARKAVRLIFALLREEKLYNPTARKGEVSDS